MDTATSDAAEVIDVADTGGADDEKPASPEFALKALQWMWEDYYEITHDEVMDLYLAKRKDGLGTLEASTPDEMRNELLEDWLLKPVAVGI